jgi:hypothetical protein
MKVYINPNLLHPIDIVCIIMELMWETDLEDKWPNRGIILYDIYEHYIISMN